MAWSALMQRGTVATMLNIGLFAAAGFVIVRPGGVVWRTAYSLHEGVRQHSMIAAAWPELTADANGGTDLDVVIFTDYQCEHCKRLDREIATLRSAHVSLNIAYRHLPNTSRHNHAGLAARIAVCAEQHGRFWEAHAMLSDMTNQPQGPNVLEVASRAAIPPTGLSACVDAQRTAERINKDAALAGMLEIRETPVLITKRRILRGYNTEAQLIELLDLDKRTSVLAVEKPRSGV